ncbi:hypothetical protein EDD21DRAFT_376212 [Dissophora ornata]|nr:hypothetical protein EDD21DRAFT_376212 [Dissophora ornata]
MHFRSALFTVLIVSFVATAQTVPLSSDPSTIAAANSPPGQNSPSPQIYSPAVPNGGATVASTSPDDGDNSKWGWGWGCGDWHFPWWRYRDWWC